MLELVEVCQNNVELVPFAALDMCFWLRFCDQQTVEA
jgi:hypothetical protein